MFENMLVTITAFYSVDETAGTIRVAGESTPNLALTVIHEAVIRNDSGKATFYSAVYFNGDGASSKIEVADRDTIIVLARQYGSIVASQVFEVDLSLPYTTGYLLIPRAGQNIICDQQFIAENEFPEEP